MNKQVNFEDTIFILNLRIRMIKDLLRLDIDTGLFYRQTMGDLDFISSVMNTLTEKFLTNIKFLDREIEADNILDTEWKFNQLLNELSNNGSPYVSFPETLPWIDKLKGESEKRRKQLEEITETVEHSMAEPLVTHAELNGLLGAPQV